MTRETLANKLRDYFSQTKRVSRNKMGVFSDDEVINIHNTCSCCNQDLLDADELDEIIKSSDELDVFFEKMDKVIDARDGSHEDDDTDEGYDKALLN